VKSRAVKIAHKLVLEPLVSLRLVLFHLCLFLLCSNVPLLVVVILRLFLGFQHLGLGALILLL